MLNTRTFILAAIAVLFSLTACAADPETGQAPSTAADGVKAVEPAKLLQASITNDTMGYLFADVKNPTDMAMDNVFVVVLHLDENTGMPDRQTNPMLVAKRLLPGRAARIQLQGLQVFKQAEFNLYRVVVVRAEPVN